MIAPNLGGEASQTLGDGLREAAFDSGHAAQVVLDAGGAVVMINDSARRMFGLGTIDLGRPIQDLELSYRPVELRAHLEAVRTQQRSVEVTTIRFNEDGKERTLDLRLTPLIVDGSLIGAVITYSETTDTQLLHEQLASSKRDLERASEELQSTVEELETTNEELQSTNEELETTNEELQSTNEELETTNEELQSSNEELETMNDELRHRSVELDDTNTFLETILSAYGIAVAVIDQNQQVRLWNGHAYELWGLTAEEVQSRSLLALDFGLPVDALSSQLRACLNGGSERQDLLLEATNRRGKAFQCRVTCVPLAGDGDGRAPGAILMMEAVDG
jgi:two-component system CheB/CheR fusion protein